MWKIHQYDELTSTQELARQMLEAGTGGHADVYQALHQTAGKGRYGTRSWLDEPGENLLVSIILTDVPISVANQMQFVCGIATVNALRSLLTIQGTDPNDIRLKWTNDVLINKRKIAGILCDALWSSTDLKGIVAGIGINVNQMFFDSSLRTPATSLRLETNLFYPIDEVRSELLKHIERAISFYTTSAMLINDVRKELEWMKSLERFDVITTDGTAESNLKYVGITDEGSLWTVTEQGEIRVFQNATLRF
jgi:BirA family biotin operon repressor/biotin-[acetyl-CoA-carboxylase] ligase